ncbi:MAG TPA: glutamate-1-semialdehyde 2,1-aminomutase [Candidatus Acidoferrales bacterium]|jgi:glutamate-1-semialdehyde 2,1-aminomutase|nr:glutamate-1-semialdehyde 2,1-aminomutase [Candidatus Acidoferrales bacterium]
MKLERSITAFARARKTIAGGVNSPVRALGAVGLSPVFMKSGAGAMLYDLDGHEYIDYLMSWGALLLGHAHPAVSRAITNAVTRGTSFGTPTEQESEMAEMIASMIPSMHRVRFVSTGAEATSAAVRLARGFTGRPKVVKFAGCYHGSADSFLIAAGSGALTHGVPDSPGVTEGTARDTIVLPFNDDLAVERAFERHPDSIAAVIVEPYPGNMGLVLPRHGYLRHLRQLCTHYGALLIFDEVISGFRVARGGAQELESVVPDLTTLGKVIGGGLPAAAFGGRSDVMAHLSPEGPVYQAGTLSGNPLAMAAGLATLNVIAADPTFYARLDERTRQLTASLSEAMERHGVPYRCNRAGSMFTIFFTPDPVEDLEGARRSDRRFFAKYFAAMLERGVYLAPSPYETNFVSTAHTPKDVERTVVAAEASLAQLMATT